jgi:hypothetical protein
MDVQNPHACALKKSLLFSACGPAVSKSTDPHMPAEANPIVKRPMKTSKQRLSDIFEAQARHSLNIMLFGILNPYR